MRIGSQPCALRSVLAGCCAYTALRCTIASCLQPACDCAHDSDASIMMLTADSNHLRQGHCSILILGLEKAESVLSRQSTDENRCNRLEGHRVGRDCLRTLHGVLGLGVSISRVYYTPACWWTVRGSQVFHSPRRSFFKCTSGVAVPSSPVQRRRTRHRFPQRATA